MGGESCREDFGRDGLIGSNKDNDLGNDLRKKLVLACVYSKKCAAI